MESHGRTHRACLGGSGDQHDVEVRPNLTQGAPALVKVVSVRQLLRRGLVARAAVPHMLRQRWGRIINITMNHDTMRRAGFSPYGPSKAALESETVIWAQDLAGSGVTVNGLLPGGATDTGMIPASVSEAVRRHLLRPEVMVEPLLWLASEASADITGTRLDASALGQCPGAGTGCSNRA